METLIAGIVVILIAGVLSFLFLPRGRKRTAAANKSDVKPVVTIPRAALPDFPWDVLLNRPPARIELKHVEPYVRDNVVLVTGAGGSIGSEICRQVSSLQPKQLLLMGHGENSLFAIQQELAESGFERTRIVLADVGDIQAVRNVFASGQPDIVLHAAAHKHVPILEQNVCEAVRNNIFGTHNVALAAAAAGTGRVVLLSTDKAVNPTSVMGATKRACELICQSFAHRTPTEFMSVRFGNVLGSRGSVLPLFIRQVQKGGPVTITHRDMERFFMTIPEAVSLVLEAMVMGYDGQVFVLDMGKPMKIIDVARRVIEYHGLVPYRDIDIVETGMRPGERLYEELLTEGEGMTRTSHERLYIAEQERVEYDLVAASIAELQRAVRISDVKTTVTLLQTLVPSFTPGAHLAPRPESVPVIHEVEAAARAASSSFTPAIAPAS
ncbi:MAG TPA: SDR family NAD(P)-dependent oxidoreductase [Candidatus Acidoferrales bacterium]|nr:SDR family NAD(P)-dependent oxidoreductase [Candidatus Acidoferrales bacterium]